jgi:hypothetical protein
MFGSNYTREAAFTDQQWQDRINGHNSDCFGLFCGDQLIGVTGIVIDKDDPTLALMTQSYIRKEHRGTASNMLRGNPLTGPMAGVKIFCIMNWSSGKFL